VQVFSHEEDLKTVVCSLTHSLTQTFPFSFVWFLYILALKGFLFEIVFVVISMICLLSFIKSV